MFQLKKMYIKRNKTLDVHDCVVDIWIGMLVNHHFVWVMVDYYDVDALVGDGGFIVGG